MVCLQNAKGEINIGRPISLWVFWGRTQGNDSSEWGQSDCKFEMRAGCTGLGDPCQQPRPCRQLGRKDAQGRLVPQVEGRPPQEVGKERGGGREACMCRIMTVWAGVISP